MRAIVHRPHVNALLGEVNLERVARILERNFAVHVGPGQVEHDGRGMRRRIRTFGDAMQRDFVEWRFADRRLEAPFVNSRRTFEFARRANGTELRGRGNSKRDEKNQAYQQFKRNEPSNLHGPNPLHNFASPHKSRIVREAQ